MFSDYKAAVVADYKKKQDDGSLSLSLINPTPAGLKRECLLVLEKRPARSDFRILRLFFGVHDNAEEYEIAIRNADIDKFKPLQKFMRGETTSPSDNIIEVLAWLIDFTPRPYQLGFTISDINSDTGPKLDEKVQAEALNLEDAQSIFGGSGLTTTSNPYSGKSEDEAPIVVYKKYKKHLLLGLLVLLGSAIGLSVKNSISPQSMSIFGENNQCMYWSGDHYIQVACDTRFAYGQVIALDRFRLDHFRKIKRPDTLIEAHVNKVWYSKTNNKIELYTADGNHPEQLHKRLRPLSKYMFDKYVFRKKGVTK